MLGTPHTVHMLCTHSAHTMYTQTVHMPCTHTAQTVYTHSTQRVHTLYMPFTHTTHNVTQHKLHMPCTSHTQLSVFTHSAVYTHTIHSMYTTHSCTRRVHTHHTCPLPTHCTRHAYTLTRTSHPADPSRVSRLLCPRESPWRWRHGPRVTGFSGRVPTCLAFPRPLGPCCRHPSLCWGVGTESLPIPPFTAQPTSVFLQLRSAGSVLGA